MIIPPWDTLPSSTSIRHVPGFFWMGGHMPPQWWIGLRAKYLQSSRDIGKNEWGWEQVRINGNFSFPLCSAYKKIQLFRWTKNKGQASEGCKWKKTSLAWNLISSAAQKKEKWTKPTQTGSRRNEKSSKYKKAISIYFSHKNLSVFQGESKSLLLLLIMHRRISFDKAVFRLFCKQDQFSISCVGLKYNMCSQFANQKKGVFLRENFEPKQNLLVHTQNWNVTMKKGSKNIFLFPREGPSKKNKCLFFIRVTRLIFRDKIYPFRVQRDFLTV